MHMEMEATEYMTTGKSSALGQEDTLCMHLFAEGRNSGSGVLHR